MSSPPPHRTALALIVLTALLWSSSGLFFKLVAWHPLAIFGGRAVIASVAEGWIRLRAADVCGFSDMERRSFASELTGNCAGPRLEPSFAIRNPPQV